MPDVTGPISTLPGSGHSVPKGMTCDYHDDRPAVARIQGETDSMGCEMIDLCEECLREHRESIRSEDTSGPCDWCKAPAEKRFFRRDYDEGTRGRVYEVCRDCAERQRLRLEEELDRHDAEHDAEFDCDD